MIWIHPAAAVALAALAVPVLIHILARQRATRVPFPTLRFIHPRRLASARRRMLEDRLLLVLRAAVLGCAAGALAGPFVVTAPRLRKWDSQTIHADVAGTDLAGSLRRGVSWLDHQPPGRRELVVHGAIPIGALTETDIAAVPAHVGIRFERDQSSADRVLHGSNVVDRGRVVEREITLSGDRTSVRDGKVIGESAASVEFFGPSDQRASLERLRARFEAERRPAAIAGRSARVEFGSPAAPGASGALAVSWMADAAAAIAREVNPGDASAATIAIHFGSNANRLEVQTSLDAGDERAIDVLRAAASSLAPPASHPADEIVPIADAQLRAWAREPAPALPPTKEMIDGDDRRWLWALVLILMAVEMRVRRAARPGFGFATGATGASSEGPSRAA